eukprot:s9126_g2.t1
MDLERETRRAKEKVEESIHDFGDKICAFEEAIKDKEQAVHFGARCLSCNRTFDDVVKTPGTVNLPAEKRRAQAVVFRGVGRIAMRRAFISESQGLALPDQVRLRDIVTGLAHPSCSQAFCVVGGCHRAYLISVPS